MNEIELEIQRGYDRRDEALKAIATTLLGIETLAVRNRDRLDFYEVYVGKIREALEAAYEQGGRQCPCRIHNTE